MRLATVFLVCLILGLAINLNSNLQDLGKDGKIMDIFTILYNRSMGLARLFFNYHTTPAK